MELKTRRLAEVIYAARLTAGTYVRGEEEATAIEAIRAAHAFEAAELNAAEIIRASRAMKAVETVRGILSAAGIKVPDEIGAPRPSEWWRR